MSLGTDQEKFQRMMTEFKTWILDQGYEIRGGDAFRDPRVHGELGEKVAYGHRNSCHKLKLAEDLYIRDDVMIKTFDEHLPLGEKWESMGGSWGGRFPSVDCVHFSLSRGGMK